MYFSNIFFYIKSSRIEAHTEQTSSRRAKTLVSVEKMGIAPFEDKLVKFVLSLSSLSNSVVCNQLDKLEKDLKKCGV